VDGDFRTIQEQIHNYELIVQECKQIQQNQWVLMLNQKMLENTKFFKSSAYDLDAQALQYKLNYYTGIIPTEDAEQFKRLIFRVSKGNAYTQVLQVGDEDQTASVYMVVFAGGVHHSLKTRVTRVCDSFGGRRFDIP
jgi:V-type H+-transporting ATPase subunit a